MTPPRLLTLVALSAVAGACADASPTSPAGIDESPTTQERPTAAALRGPDVANVVGDIDVRLLAVLPAELRSELAAPLARLHRSLETTDAAEQDAAAVAFLAALHAVADRVPEDLRPDVDVAVFAMEHLQ